MAALNGSSEAIDVLLATAEGRAAAKEGDKNGYTPVHIAASFGNANAAEKLLGLYAQLPIPGLL